MRRLALLLASLCVALELVGGVAAKTEPRPPRTLPHVSAIVPYLAPWRSDFERYSTQLVPPKSLAATFKQWFVPQGQWWRIVFVSAELSTDANPGNRVPSFQIRDPSGNIVFTTATPLAVPPSTQGFVTYGPNLQPFSNAVAAGTVFGEAPVPDVLLGPGFEIDVGVAGAGGAGDSYPANAIIAGVEVYTPSKTTPGALVQTPAIP